jgi:mycothiol synthase
MVERAEVARRARVLDREALEGAASPAGRRARAALGGGTVGGGHPAARVHTGTVAAMRQVEIVRPSGRAHLERVPSGWSVDLDHPKEVDDATDVLRAAIDAVRDDGGGLLRHWARAGDPVASAASTALGLTVERELLQLRRPLPVAEPWDLEVRPFVIGQDEAAWLEVNNRAFEWHPEQGHWTPEDLEARFTEPWFDPAGFLLHEADGRLAGFCWTKQHRDEAPPLGEIYVIAVDPSAGGRGLGRSLTLAGLDHLHRAGLDVGMLYVDGTNEAGRRLYDQLGFTLHHTDRSYTIEVPAP